MTEKRFINDVSEILDTYFGYMGTKEPSEREIKEKDYLLIGVARSQRDAESICEKLNEQNEELISYCNFSLHDVLDKKNKEIEQLKSDNNRLVNETAKVVAEHQSKVFKLIDEKIDELEGRYKFGQEVYRGCPMHNIRFGINVLKELKKELQE